MKIVWCSGSINSTRIGCAGSSMLGSSIHLISKAPADFCVDNATATSNGVTSLLQCGLGRFDQQEEILRTTCLNLNGLWRTHPENIC